MNTLSRILIARLLLALALLTVPGLPSLAQPADDAAWRAFQHALGAPAPIGANADHALAAAVTRPFPAVDVEAVSPRKYLLGSDLFGERALSVDGSIGCFICHAGPMSGTDGRTIPSGVGRAPGKVNAPTTFNAVFNFRQFWNGRAITLADQATMPIVTAHEMANTLDNVLAMLRADAAYAEDFSALYPDGVSADNLADALAHFERSAFAVTDTPFQRYLQGDTSALSEQEARGWQRFQAIGCSSCHNGLNLGGNSYQKLGAFTPWFPNVREPGPNDAGLAERTNRPQDQHVVKVPSLHNVAVTEPYLHDGSLDSLQSVTAAMARHQLGRELSEEDLSDIVAFLVALNGPPEGLRLEGEIAVRAMMDPCGIGSGGTEPRRSELAREQCWQLNPSQTHTQAYTTTQAALLPTHTRLLADAEAIDAGQVAHFDFLQAEHLELIRHARALQHPPSEFSAAGRTCLQDGAQRVLQEVMLLELPIADYLQARAMLGVLDAHEQDPAPDSPPAATLRALRNTQEAAASFALQALHEAPLAETFVLLDACSP
jgi:cytochrome c peroxidase